MLAWRTSQPKSGPVHETVREEKLPWAVKSVLSCARKGSSSAANPPRCSYQILFSGQGSWPAPSAMRPGKSDPMPRWPHDYGLVVIDRDARWIGNHQRCCRPMSFLPQNAPPVVSRKKRFFDVATPEYNPAGCMSERFLDAWRSGAVPVLRVKDAKGQRHDIPWDALAQRRK